MELPFSFFFSLALVSARVQLALVDGTVSTPANPSWIAWLNGTAVLNVTVNNTVGGIDLRH